MKTIFQIEKKIEKDGLWRVLFCEFMIKAILGDLDHCTQIM